MFAFGKFFTSLSYGDIFRKLVQCIIEVYFIAKFWMDSKYA